MELNGTPPACRNEIHNEMEIKNREKTDDDDKIAERRKKNMHQSKHRYTHTNLQQCCAV